MITWDLVRVMAVRLVWSIRVSGISEKSFKNADDPFQSIQYNLPYQMFGSPRPFSSYLSGTSEIEVKTIDDIKNFLAKQCLYKSDRGRFGRLDYWQTPVEFEKNKEGDCEDSALWAWCKLIEMGISAHFVSGVCVYQEKKYIAGHAWVIFKNNEQWYIFESASKSIEHIVISLEKARNIYYPLCSTDSLMQTYIYPGVGLLSKRPDFGEMRVKIY